MLPTDIFDTLAAKPTYVVLVDRREGQIAKTALETPLHLIQSWSAVSADGRETVFMGLFDPGAAVPKSLVVSGVRYRRLMDRFLLPEMPGQGISEVFFDTIASSYEAVAHLETNRAMARQLLRAVSSSGLRTRVLDFGCGTGVVGDVALSLADEGYNIVVTGTDVSAEMVKLAISRGQSAIGITEWTALPPGVFDGAVANFVLHYGVSFDQLKIIANQIVRGGKFAANYFKPPENALTDVVESLQKIGLVPGKPIRLDDGPSDNFLIIAVKE